MADDSPWFPPVNEQGGSKEDEQPESPQAERANLEQTGRKGRRQAATDSKSSWLGPAKGRVQDINGEQGGCNVAQAVQPINPQSPAERPRISFEDRSYFDNIVKEKVDQVMAIFVDEAAEKLLAELENEPLYHGALPLEDIAAIVPVPGDFLIRELEPEEGRGPMPCLTVRVDAQLKDYPIHTIQVGNARMFTIDGVNKANSVVGIVQKHYQEKIRLQDEGILLKPVPKQPWELSKDKIVLQSRLGEGAFGEVWKGTLRQSVTKTVDAAIKVMKLKEDNKKYMQEMYKEARLMRQYKHVNVVAFYGMVMESDNVMIVMEMVNGGGLDHHLKTSSVGIPDKCSYAFDVALGLYYLHSKRCMHRDLACRNCLIDTQKNIVKISDFGLSKQADSYKILATEKIPTKWQAPEVVATHIYTRECDVYSYGILVWEIFNNAKMPFEEYDNKTVRTRISDPKFRPPLSNDFPDEIRVIVTACWSAQPANRPVMKDVAWILKRFQKHNVPAQVVRKPTPAAPVTKPTSPGAAPKAMSPAPAPKAVSPAPGARVAPMRSAPSPMSNVKLAKETVPRARKTSTKIGPPVSMAPQQLKSVISSRRGSSGSRKSSLASVRKVNSESIRRTDRKQALTALKGRIRR